jgi:hypothetical protein
MMVIRDFNGKIEENKKKATKEKNFVEKAKMDLKEMSEELPFFKNEKRGLIDSIDETLLKEMSNINKFY